MHVPACLDLANEKQQSETGLGNFGSFYSFVAAEVAAQESIVAVVSGRGAKGEDDEGAERVCSGAHRVPRPAPPRARRDAPRRSMARRT